MNIIFPELTAYFLVSSFFCALAAVAVLKSQQPKNLKILRVLGLLLLLTIIFSPKLVLLNQPLRRTVAVVIDISDSMFISKRIQKVKSYLKNNQKYLTKNFNPVYFAFADSHKIITEDDIINLKSAGGTDITGALTNISNAFPEKPDAIFLFSDGVQSLRKTSQDDFDLSVPVFAFDIFGDAVIRDISIREVSHPEFAFKGRDIPISVDISCINIPRGTRIAAKLADNFGYSQSSEILVTGGSNEISFKYKPTKIGRRSFYIDVSSKPFEITTKNNRVEFQIDILREKTRVLYLCGQPSYEYSFLRSHLKNDKNIELVSFVILRNPEDISLVPDAELSLIPFPGEDLLTNQIGDFDIIIFENFSFGRFGIHPAQFEYLKKWVEQGGGFLMIGGDNTFGKSGYQYTAIKDILPVIMDEPGEPIKEGLFNPRIVNPTAPIFSLTDGKKNLWEELPPLDGAQKLRARTGSTVLIEHPWARTESGNIVVLAARNFGKGRTAALGSNSTWRWKMTGDNPVAYKIFWRNILNYLSGVIDAQKTTVIGLKDSAILGRPISFALQQPENGRTQVRITQPDGTNVLYDYRRQGNYDTYSFAPSTIGTHSVDVLLVRNNTVVKRENYRILVKSPLAEELTALDMDRDFLKLLCDKTGGTFIQSQNPDLDMINSKLGESASRPEKIYDLRNLWFFLLLFVLITLELLTRWRKHNLW